MKRSWKDRGFRGWRDLVELSYPTVLSANLIQRAPGEGQAQGFLLIWARNAEAARQSIRQHFGTYYASKVHVARGVVLADELNELIPAGVPQAIMDLAEAAGDGAQLLEYAVFSLFQPLPQSANRSPNTRPDEGGPAGRAR